MKKYLRLRPRPNPNYTIGNETKSFSRYHISFFRISDVFYARELKIINDSQKEFIYLMRYQIITIKVVFS